MTPRPLFLALLLATLSLAAPAAAGTVADVPQQLFGAGSLAADLRALPLGGSMLVLDAPVAGGHAVLDVVRFEVFAPGAIVEHGATGDRRLAPPDRAWFRGRVVGEEGSWVFLSVGATEMRGFAGTSAGAWAIGPVEDGGRFRLGSSRIDPSMLPKREEAEKWMCGQEKLVAPPVEAGAVMDGDGAASPNASVVERIDVAVETDGELWSFFGSTAALSQYVGELFGASSAIYYRDIEATLRVNYLSVWTGGSGSDPWTQTNTLLALYEIGDYWHANRAGVARDIVHFLSKKNMGGGIAWLGVLCASDFQYADPTNGTHWGGGYGLVGSLNGSFSTTNPSLYWDILAVSHEIGHNFNSPHTHCYNPVIDTCYASESGCYSGQTCEQAGTSCAGTIMSYCHLRAGGYNNISLVFGVTGQPSAAVITQMKNHVASRAFCLGKTNMPAPADLDGDGTSDLVVFRNGAWFDYDFATGTNTSAWTGPGDPTCKPALMDYNGTGTKKYTELCGGAWHFYNSNGTYNKGIWTGGAAGDLPAPADYDGDGDDDVVVYRGGAWLFYDFATAAYTGGVWTGPGPNTTPVPGDYDGDGRADFSVYAGGPWHFYKRNGTYWKGIWTGGLPTDIPVPADYQGDGREEPAIFRDGAWMFFSFDTASLSSSTWTGPGAGVKPAPTDYDGDGSADLTVFATGPWHFFNDNGSYNKGLWTGGVGGDLPMSRRINP